MSSHVAARPASPQETKLNIQFNPSSERPAVQYANYFQVARVGPEIQLLVCFADMQVLVNSANKASSRSGSREVKQHAEVLHRIVLGPMGFASLKAAVDHIANNLHSKEQTGHENEQAP